jgi:uncharacterized membrane-anchored protein YhcB (DUF1043 family)
MELLEPKIGLFFWALIGLGLVCVVLVGIVLYQVLKNKDKRSQKATKQ